MRTPEGARVMPWADWSEWRELRDMVANGETERACRRVALYRLRRRNAVPITMISTVTLMRQLEYPDPDPYLQRLALSMTLIRLVNGTTDQLQPRGENSVARSVFSLAVELKLPLILVEIRHQASHNALPRLSVLESAAKKALAWLEEYYWEPQLKSIQPALEEDINGIRRVFDLINNGENVVASVVRSEPEVSSNFPERKDVKGDGSLSIVNELNALSEKLQKKKSQSMPISSEDRPRSRRPRWTLCTNFEAWRRTSLGLVPGQLRVARINDVGAKNHDLRSVGISELENDSSEDETDDSAEQAESLCRRRQHPESREHEVSGPAKKARRYSTKEEAYIAKKRTEFESIAKNAVRTENDGRAEGRLFT